MNIQQLMSIMQNPQQMLQKMGIPQEVAKTPQDVAKYLWDNGKINQSHIDQTNNLYKQLFNK